MDYNCHSRIPLADIHSKHILIIMVIVLRNLRKLHMNDFLNLNEMRTEHRRYNILLIKRQNFSRMSILKPQNSISWAGDITNEIMLLCLQNIKKHEILLLSSKGSLKAKKQIKLTQSNPCSLLCSYILYKSISVRNVIKEKIDFKQISKLPPGKVYKISQWSSIRYLKSHISNMGVNIF